MKKIAILALLIVVVVLFFQFELGQYLTLEYIKTQQQRVDQIYQQNRLLTLAAYFLFYVVITGASLPGAAVLTLAGGAIFGFSTTLILVSFASTIGASIAFLVSRYLFRDMVQSRFGSSLKAINEGIDKDGAFYLFALRLVPLFPFFVINLVMGLSSLRLWTFYWVSQLGMFAGTIAYGTIAYGNIAYGTIVYGTIVYGTLAHGTMGPWPSPNASSRPDMTFMFCTAWPDAPLTRLSVTDTMMAWPSRRSAKTPMIQWFEPRTSCVAGATPTAAT